MHYIKTAFTIVLREDFRFFLLLLDGKMGNWLNKLTSLLKFIAIFSNEGPQFSYEEDNQHIIHALEE